MTNQARNKTFAIGGAQPEILNWFPQKSSKEGGTGGQSPPVTDQLGVRGAL